MTTKAGWFEVDKVGLSQLVRRKGLSFILYELVQNSWDTSATSVQIMLTPAPGRAMARISVLDDDPDGFKDLRHAYTLYAPSEKKGDVLKRGRFNQGEKLVLAACATARISSTTGTVIFEQVGKQFTRTETRQRRDSGSMFSADIPMTRTEMEEVLQAAKLLLPPIPTVINHETLPVCKPIHTFEATLLTEVADEDGFLRRTSRKTEVRIYEPTTGTSYLYEMGIPVVELDLPWSVEVMQKIPLNSDRDNVTPSYRKTLGVAVVNAMHQVMDEDAASLSIVQEALGNPAISDAAVQTIITHRHGAKRTSFDPSDPESNHNAVAHGFSVIHGGSYSKAQWQNIRRADAAPASSKLFPTPKPYDQNGEIARIIPEKDWTDGMRHVAEFAKYVARKILKCEINVTMENEITQAYLANYGGNHLVFNTPRLGKKWFDLGSNFVEVTDLVVHELAHHYASSHLDIKYHDGTTHIAAQLTWLALTEPDTFRKFEVNF